MTRGRAVRLGKAKTHRLKRLIAERDYPKLLNAKLNALFPDVSVRARVIDVLERYDTIANEPEKERVRLAVLKLCGTNLQELEKTVEGAKQDFEDIVKLGRDADADEVCDRKRQVENSRRD